MSKILIELLSVQFKFFLQQFLSIIWQFARCIYKAFPSTISFVIFGRSQYTSSPEKAAIGCPNRDLITTMRDFPKSLVLQTICNNAIQFRKLFFESDQFPIFQKTMSGISGCADFISARIKKFIIKFQRNSIILLNANADPDFIIEENLLSICK